jgi:gluconolactonase
MPESEQATINPIVVTDVQEVEGPVCTDDGSLWMVEMAAGRACVTHASADGRTVRRLPPTGRPTGLAMDGDGHLWVAEGRNGTVLCLAQDGTVLRTIEGDDDGRFLWPNDLAFGPDGHLYLTDSGILDTDFIEGIDIRPDWETAPYDGRVYDIDPVAGKVARVLDRGIRFTNGIAFGPDDLLYVNETIGGGVFRYDVLGSRHPEREPFGNVNDPDGPPGWRGPDGMAFDREGHLYVTVYGQSDVTVLDPDGEVIERIPTNGRLPTNIAFPKDGSPKAYVTQVDGSHVEVIKTRAGGLALHEPTGLIDDAQQHKGS